MDDHVQDLLEKLEQEVLCGICNKAYDSPKLLPCLHSFCCQCLDQLARSKTRERRCPLCEQAEEIIIPQSGTFADLPSDSSLERKVDNFEEFRRKHINIDGPFCKSCEEPSGGTVAYCVECDQLLCSFCRDSHRKLCIFKGHRVKQLEDFCLADYALGRKFAHRFCEKVGHSSEKLEYFCEECVECICHVCKSVDGDHAGHDAIKTLDEAGKEAKNTIKEKYEIAKSRVCELEREIWKLNESEAEFNRQCHDSKESLTSRHAMLCRRMKERNLSVEDTERINNRRDIIMEELTSRTKSPKSRLEEQIKRIRGHVAELSKTITSAEALIQNESNYDILQKRAAFVERLIKLTDIEIDTRPVVRANITFRVYPVPAESQDEAPDYGIGELDIQFNRPSQSISEGDGLTAAFDGLQTQFIVTQRNEEGGVAYAREDPPTVSFISTSTEEALPWEMKITDQLNGQYEVAYTAKEPGSYKIAIEIAGQHIYKSPFNLLVSPREFNFQKVIGGYGSGEGQFKAPWGVAVSSKDEIAVTDQHNHRVHIFDRDGQFKKIIGGYGSDEGNFHCPIGLTYDNDDNLIVVDSNNSRLQKFNGEGKFLMQFGSKGGGDGELNLPWAVSIADQGNIIVSDKGNNRIQIFSHEGKYLAKFGNMGEEMLSWPIACVMYNNHFFVSDTSNHCVKIFTKEGVYVSKFGTEGQMGGQLIKNQGLLVDKADNVVVCDSWNDRIQLFKLDTESFRVRSCTQFGSCGNQLGCLNDPSDLAMLSNGCFVVCDYRNHRMQIIA